MLILPEARETPAEESPIKKLYPARSFDEFTSEVKRFSYNLKVMTQMLLIQEHNILHVCKRQAVQD